MLTLIGLGLLKEALSNKPPSIIICHKYVLISSHGGTLRRHFPLPRSLGIDQGGIVYEARICPESPTIAFLRNPVIVF